MPTTPACAADEDPEAEWRAALVHAEHLRLEYSHQLDVIDANVPANASERALDDLWFKLWSAERRRDDLFRAIE
jgi:hypothetical protein